MILPESFLETLRVNLDNRNLDDAGFREFCRNTLPGLAWAERFDPPVGCGYSICTSKSYGSARFSVSTGSFNRGTHHEPVTTIRSGGYQVNLKGHLKISSDRECWAIVIGLGDLMTVLAELIALARVDASNALRSELNQLLQPE